MKKYKEQSRLIAAGYCRLSDDDEKDGTSVSIETQEKILTDFCQSHGIAIYDIYKDDGYTGTNFNRPDFKRMMEDVKKGLVNVVVVKDLSRFGRNYLQVGSYISEIFPQMNVRFIAIGDDVDTVRGDTDYDLMLPIKNVFNEYYPADCSRKTKQAFISKAMNGEFIGSFAAYGLQKSQADKHVLEFNEETSSVVIGMFEMAAYQGYGYNKIALVLKEQKTLTPAAYRAQHLKRPYDKDPFDWNHTTVYKILNDKTYLGFLISGRRRKPSFKSKRIVRQDEEDWIMIPGVVPQLVSQQLWDDAHEKLDSRKRTGTTGFNNIFAGLIKCDKCGYALGIANASGRNNYYLCNTYKKKGPNCCSSHYILYRELYDAVLSDINDILQMIRENKEEFVSKVLLKFDRGCDHDDARIDKEIKALENKIADLSRKFDQLYDDRFNGILSDRKFKELSSKCEMEQDEAKAKLEMLTKRRNSTQASAQGVEQFIAMAEEYSILKELDGEILNRLIQSIVIGDRVKNNGINEQEIHISYRFIGDIA